MLDAYSFALQVAAGSKDPSTKVGDVIISAGEIICAGRNSFPAGIPDEWWEDRERKYQAVVHAEIVALCSAGTLAQGATMVVTHHPCKECAKSIIAAGIACVACPPGPWRDDPAITDSVSKARELFDLCGVAVRDIRRDQ